MRPPIGPHVPGEGPQPADLMLVGEAPGYHESNRLRPFVGKSGMELTRYLERARIPRHSIYITNLCKRQPPVINNKQRPPSKEDIRRDEPELIEEILACRPRWIGAVGRFAARWLLDRDITLEASHGLAFEAGPRLRERLRRAGSATAARAVNEDGDWIDDLRIIPLYHPAAGLHNAELAPLVWWDIQQLGQYVHGELAPFNAVDEFPDPEYFEWSGEALELPGDVAIDTEGVPGAPWCLSFAARPGMAEVIRVVDQRGLRQFSQALDDSTSRIVMHNALYDVPLLGEMGVEVDWSRVEDTMLMLFCLRLLPLGLKPVSLRLSGARQQTFDELMAPAERRLALGYIQEAIDARRCNICRGSGRIPAHKQSGKDAGRLLKRTDPCPNPRCVDGGLWPRREPQPSFDYKLGRWKLSTGWEIGRYLRTLKQDIESGVFDSIEGDDDDSTAEHEGDERKPKTVRQRWKSWDDAVREPVEQLLGPMPAPTMDDLPLDEAVHYAARDADLTLRNYPKISAMIDAMGLRKAYRIDLAVIPAAAEIERNGMLVDTDRLKSVAKRLRRENDEILHRLRRAAGRAINPASGDQVAALLFGDRRLSFDQDDERDLLPSFSFELQSDKQTRSGKRAATDDKVLEGLKLKYADRPEVVEVVQLVLDYRMRHKIITTYAEKIPRIVDRNGRVHTRIRPTTAATFRWASGDPINLQNIPIRNKGGADLGRLVRECFIAPDGQCLASADYSQVELRILAAFSGDAELLRAFREGLDPHIIGASRAWSLSYDEIKQGVDGGVQKFKDIRDSSKNLNFGIVFGITPRGLQAQLELRGMRYTLEQCAELIHMWIYETFPGIGEYIEETKCEARQYGFVRSLMGHIRYCPGVWSQIASIREEAERQAVNFKIQTTAAEVLKVGLADLWNRGKKMLDMVKTLLLMSVHDENLLQVWRNAVAMDVTSTTVETYMQNPIELPNGVQITTSMKFADNWGALK